MRNAAPLRMHWRDVAFLHWAASPAAVAARLPPGVVPDLFGGDAWLSVVPFRMTDIRAAFAPVLPGFARVAELNLRTYVRVRDKPGVWFFSLDATSPALVITARIGTGLPYYDAQIATAETPEGITYASVRRDPRAVPGEFSAAYRPRGDARAAAPGTLEHFLHERYCFFGSKNGRLVIGELRHAPWSLERLDVLVGSNSLGRSAGLPLSARPDIAYFGRGVEVAAAPARPF